MPVIDRTLFNALLESDGSPNSGDVISKQVLIDTILDPMDAALAASTGDVSGPASSVDDRIATFDGTTGKLLQDGGATIAGVIASAVAAGPAAHAPSHKSGGSDAIKLDELAAPTDITTLNATTGAHGLLPKLGGGTTNYLRADGTWNAPAGGGGGTPGGSDTQVQFNDGGAFGGDAGLTYNKTSDTLTVGQIATSAQPRCSAYHNTTQSLSNATTTVLNFNSETYDIGSMHDTATNNSRVTIPTGGDGLYLVIAFVWFAGNATGKRYIDINKNNATVLGTAESTGLGSDEQSVSRTVVVALAAADYLELRAHQTSGGSLAVGSGSAESASRLTVVKLW